MGNSGAARWPPRMDEYGYFMASSGTRDAHSRCAQGSVPKERDNKDGEIRCLTVDDYFRRRFEHLRRRALAEGTEVRLHQSAQAAYLWRS